MWVCAKQKPVQRQLNRRFHYQPSGIIVYSYDNDAVAKDAGSNLTTIAHTMVIIQFHAFTSCYLGRPQGQCWQAPLTLPLLETHAEQHCLSPAQH